MTSWKVLIGVAVASALAWPAPARAQDESALKRLTLTELLDVELSTFSRLSERTTDVPAAVYVITQDDIRRSGAVTLAQALRLAPGVQIARIDASRYAVGIRGFADRLSRAVLVMIDGRAVYSPLFAGTYWEVQDTFFDDIDRIEVIRGPGATLWGPNAVNGVINIITKPAGRTQGVVVTGASGSQLDAAVSARVGGAIGASAHWRAYGKAVGLPSQFRSQGPQYDGLKLLQGGTRLDWTLQRDRTVTIQGDAYTSRQGQQYALASLTAPFSVTGERDAALSGGNALARFSGQVGKGEMQVQGYYDRATRDERPVAEVRDTFDAYFQHRPRPGARHDVIWGASSRRSSDEIKTVGLTRFTPEAEIEALHGLFVQDDVTLRPTRLRLVAGMRVDHNSYSGWEVQPTGRVIWTLSPKQTMVGSVTRAVRTPSRVERSYETTSLSSPAQPAFVRLQPNGAFQPEVVVAYEAIYRRQATDTLHLSLSGFFNHLDNVLSTELLTPFVESDPPPARVILPVTFANGLRGNSHGFEANADWRPRPWLRATGSYALARLQLTRRPGSNDVSQERRGEGLTPHHQVQSQAAVDLPRGLQFDWTWRFVSALPAGGVPAYATSDVRLSWQVRRSFELAVVGQNLHDAHHLEWPSGLGGNVEIRRSAYASLTWRR